MQAERHLEILRAEGGHIAAIPADALDAPVPTLPDWTVERVVRHLGKIHQWVAATLTTDPSGPPVDTSTLAGIPAGPACLPAYRQALDATLRAFDEVGTTASAPSFTGETVDTAWWARRQAHEVAIHRIDAHDAIHARGGPAPAPLAVDGAADGIDEWARVFLAVRFAQRFGDLPPALEGRTIHIHGTDDPAPPDGAEWLLTFDQGRVEVVATHAKGDVALRGPAQDLLLALWRRRPLESLDVIGARSVADDLLDAARF